MDVSNLLMRMAHWLRHPPSRRQVQVMIVVAAVAAACVALEAVFGWPEWLTVQRGPLLPRP